jgi:hypothetical protein
MISPTVINVMAARELGRHRIIIEIGPRTMKIMLTRPVGAAAIMRHTARDATAMKARAKVEKAAVKAANMVKKAAVKAANMKESAMIKLPISPKDKIITG